MLMFLVWPKNTIGHKCVKSQLYQLEADLEPKGEEFQECRDNFEEIIVKEETLSPTLSLHALKGS